MRCDMARLNAVSEIANAAINAVTVVPMLAPIIKGNACLRVILFVAANGTIKEVVTELDCTAAVSSVPIPND
jgi:hypothetical protein